MLPDGYKLKNLIYESNRTLVYRALRLADQQPVIIKTCASEAPDPSHLAMLRLEYEILSKFDFDSIIRVFALEQFHNQLFLIEPDHGGMPFHIFLKNKINDLSLLKKISLAVNLTDIAGLVHSADVIHRDLNPANFLIEPENLQLCLIDFGIATTLSQFELQPAQIPGGTLAYVSPEQSGRINRKFDHRADLYSLGVMLYEIFTGQLPFTEKEPMALIHAHIARKPVSPAEINPGLPAMLSEIILKLLEKEPEARYRSAKGLKNDLLECTRQLEKNNTIAFFPTGQNDISEKLEISKKIYGRSKETEALLAAYNQPRASGKLLLVSGQPGMGKSALVHELRNPISKKNGHLIEGKFDQYQSELPFSGFIQAFSQLCGQVLSGQQHEINQIRHHLLTSLGPNGQIMIQLVPNLELVLGSQPAVPELPANENQNRFQLVFQNFIRAFALGNRPLVIFLDDLQWADQASLDLLALLATETEGDLFLIGSYRQTETGQPLARAIHKISKTGGQIGEIFLGPLNKEEITELLCDTLFCQPGRARPLADLIVQKTLGNPFFAHEFIKTLYKSKILFFNTDNGQWQWDIQKIQNANITDNVIELMSEKINNLSAGASRICQLAACIGHQFDLKTLTLLNQKLFQISSEETFFWLQETIREGLIVAGEELYQTSKINTGNEASRNFSYKFLHDRVQQAAYQFIADEQKKVIHLALGRLWLNNLAEKDNQQIFDIARHCNLAKNITGDQNEIEQIVNLNLLAGKRALVVNAYAAALEYAQIALELLPAAAKNWQNNYRQTLELHNLAIKAACLAGDYDRVSGLVATTVHHAQNTLDAIEAHELQILAYATKGEPGLAVKHAIAVLAGLGLKFPPKPQKHHLALAYLQIRLILGRKDISKLANLPEMKDPTLLAAMRVLNSFSTSLYMSLPTDLRSLFYFKMVYLTLRHGNNPQAAISFCILAAIQCSPLIGEIKSGSAFGELALKIAAQDQTRKLKPEIHFSVYQLIFHYRNPVRLALEPLLQAYQYALETGNLEFAFWSASGYCHYLFITADNLETVESEYGKYYNLARRHQQHSAMKNIGIEHETVKNLMGKSPHQTLLLGSSYDENSYTARFDNQTELMLLILNKLLLCVIFEENDRALALANQGRAYLDNILSSTSLTKYYFFDTLSRLACFSQFSAAQKRKELKTIRASIRQMKIWAHHAPFNHLQKLKLMQAELARARGKDRQALELYDEAIEAASNNQNTGEEALALELAGRFHLQKKRDRIAGSYLESAGRVYRQWGAEAKANALQTKYPHYFKAAKKAGHGSTVSASTEIIQSLDLSAIFRATTAISGEIVLDRLLQHLTRIAIENAGAEKVSLFLMHENSLCLLARGFADKSTQIIDWQKIESAEGFPRSVVNYVSRTAENLLVDDAASDNRFAKDPYIAGQSVKSILCLPIVHLGVLAGVYYLENNLVSGAFSPERIGLLKLLSGQIAVSINNAVLYDNLDLKVKERTRELEAKNKSMEHDIALARKIQNNLIPKTPPANFIATLYQPMQMVGGDFFDFIKFENSDKTGIFLSDVSGHGVAAAFITSMIKTILLQMGTKIESPAGLLAYLNEVLQAQTSGHFITVFYGIYNPADRSLHYANAGHNQPYIISAGSCRQIDQGKSIPIAILPNSELSDSGRMYENYREIIPAGSKLLLYTDGLVEATPASGDEFFEHSEMKNSFQKNLHFDSHGFISGLFSSLENFRQSQDFDDDICLICLDID